MPGGVAVDLDRGGAARRSVQLIAAVADAAFRALVELYDNTASLQDRTVGTGILSAELARAIRRAAALSAAPRAAPSMRGAIFAYRAL